MPREWRLHALQTGYWPKLIAYKRIDPAGFYQIIQYIVYLLIYLRNGLFHSASLTLTVYTNNIVQETQSAEDVTCTRKFFYSIKVCTRKIRPCTPSWAIYFKPKRWCTPNKQKLVFYWMTRQLTDKKFKETDFTS